MIEMASGLSARSIRLVDLSESYYEIDLPHMIDFKKICLDAHKTNHLHHPKMNWIPLDLKNLTSQHLLQWTNQSQTTLIAEGLMMYLNREQQHTLWTLIAQNLPPKSVFIFDLVPTVEQPKPGIIGRFLGKCMSYFTGGNTFQIDQRTRHDLIDELHLCGFTRVELFDLSNFKEHNQFTLPFPNKKTQNLIFIAHSSHETPL